MYDRSLRISTMLFRAPSFGSVPTPDVLALDRQRNAEGLDSAELDLRCCICWMPLKDEARCEGGHHQERA
jgi:hypothetical protein